MGFGTSFVIRNRTRRLLAQKPAAIVTSARRAGTTSALEALEKVPQFCQMPLISSTYWPMVHGSNAEQAALDEEGMQIMRNLGHNMAWILKCIAAGKAAGIEPPKAENTVHEAQHAGSGGGIMYRSTKHNAVGLFHQRQNINDWPAEYAVSGFGAAAAAHTAAHLQVTGMVFDLLPFQGFQHFFGCAIL